MCLLRPQRGREALLRGAGRDHRRDQPAGPGAGAGHSPSGAHDGLLRLRFQPLRTRPLWQGQQRASPVVYIYTLLPPPADLHLSSTRCRIRSVMFGV